MKKLIALLGVVCCAAFDQGSPVNARMQTGPEGLSDGATASAMVEIYDPSKRLIGAGQLRQIGRDIVLTMDVTILPPGPYAVTLNATGKCKGNDFAAAGAALRLADLSEPTTASDDMKANSLTLAISPVSTYGRLERNFLNVDLKALLSSDGASLVISSPVAAPSPSIGTRLACGVWTADY